MYNNRTGSYQQQQPKPKKEYKTPRDIWDAENRNTFFKATTLFAGEDGNYDSRYHFSFVKHSGKPNCTQEYAIEIFVPMVKAGSDGSKIMGVNASGLAADMVNGNLFLEAERARKSRGKQEISIQTDFLLALVEPLLGDGQMVKRNLDNSAFLHPTTPAILYIRQCPVKVKKLLMVVLFRLKECHQDAQLL